MSIKLFDSNWIAFNKNGRHALCLC